MRSFTQVGTGDVASMDNRNADHERTSHSDSQSYEVVLWLLLIASGIAMAAGVTRMISDHRGWGIPVSVGGLIAYVLIWYLLRPIPRQGESSPHGRTEHDDQDSLR